MRHFLLPCIGRSSRLSCRLQHVARSAVQTGKFPVITYVSRPGPQGDTPPHPSAFVYLDSPEDLALFVDAAPFRKLSKALRGTSGTIFVAADPGE